MKVLHVVYSYPPDPPGGTEVLVSQLAKIESSEGVEVSVAAPSERNETYEHQGTRVHRFAMSPDLDMPALYGEGDKLAAEGFAGIVSRVRPDVVNFHAWTPAVSLLTVREAQRLGAATLFCYHTPAASCVRGTLLLNGQSVCDGLLDRRRCTRCALQGRGMPAWSTYLPSILPAGLGIALSGLLPRRVTTVLRTSESIGRLHERFRELLHAVNHVVAPCVWARDLLHQNGLPLSRVTVCRQGANAHSSPDRKRCAASTAKPRIAYFGRAHPSKGVALLLEALTLAGPDGPSLDVFAVAQSDPERQAIDRWKSRYASKSCIRFLASVTPEAVAGLLRDYDYLAVPSETMETGPLVVHEAIAARVPVVGANLGGIAELISHEQNGLLVEPGNVAAWSAALKRVGQDLALRERLAAALPRPRTIHDMASEFRKLYEQALLTARLSGIRQAT